MTVSRRKPKGLRPAGQSIWRRSIEGTFVLLIILTLLLSACAEATEPPAQEEPAADEPSVEEPSGPKQGGTLVIAMDAEADILDPTSAGGWITWRVNRNMFDTLVMEDLTQENVDVPPRIPGLAERWETSDDGLEWTFYLREGVKFHDGTMLDAEVVKWNIERMWDESKPHYSAKAAS